MPALTSFSKEQIIDILTSRLRREAEYAQQLHDVLKDIVERWSLHGTTWTLQEGAGELRDKAVWLLREEE